MILGRWLLDNDKDDEGLRVIAALCGRSPGSEDENDDLGRHNTVQEEFQEIKERVLFDVRGSSLSTDASANNRNPCSWLIVETVRRREVV